MVQEKETILNNKIWEKANGQIMKLVQTRSDIYLAIEIINLSQNIRIGSVNSMHAASIRKLLH